MCGIFGYFDQQGKPLAKDIVKEMGLTIKHRGPDNQGIYFSEGLALGNQRLSIIDLEGGNQPFISDNGHVALVQNGEIFNYIELKEILKKKGRQFVSSSDTEVLLRAYEEWGLDFISKLNGMFAIAIHDKSKQETYLIRDRAGEKPLYWGEHSGRFFFCSEIKSILKIEPFFKKINFTALGQYFQLGYVPPPLTMFEGLRHIQPGHILTLNSSGAKTKPWWQLQDIRLEENKTEQQAIEEIQSIFSDAVRIRMRTDVPFGAFLSGGIDSSYNVAEMTKWQSRQTNTFNISFSGTKFDEHQYALYAANKFNTKHTTTEATSDILNEWARFIYHCDQPHADVSFIPTLKVSERAVKNVKMVLTGDGADELYAGYRKHLYFQESLKQAPSSSVVELYLKQNQIYSKKDLQELLTHNGDMDLLSRMLHEQVNTLSAQDPVNQYLGLEVLNLLPGNNLVKPDRMGMAVSLEGRPPFMDHRLIEHAFSIPGSLKLLQNETKYLLKKASLPMLGEEIVYRKKQMFSVPITDWNSINFATIAETLLLSKKAMIQNYVNIKTIKNSLNGYKQNPRDYLKPLRLFISFEIWLQIYINDVQYEHISKDFLS